MEKTELEGTYLVTANSILYFTDHQFQVIHFNSPKCESDAQQLHRRMPEFLEDIRRSHGPSYLFIKQRITPSILGQMLKEDFFKLDQEAQKVTQIELKEIVTLTHFAEALSQEEAYVANRIISNSI
ncbi:7333_t:CDS:2 [Racocetra fulgida]|uniref:7333_t:CDS:1 n=1 Tax=Racocetra fulgida TaxID=60492 RepID=A0A9N9H037_9GLOM|nr:7333_t:CDS:2 [Racocetra fulgida]